MLAGEETPGPQSPDDFLRKAEPWLRAAFERRELAPKAFVAEWLPDSSGYTVMEPVPGSDEPARVQYEVPSGKRTVLGPAPKPTDGGAQVLSPDGQRAVFSEKGNLHVRDLRSGATQALTRDGDGDAISNEQPVWSPDGRRIAFLHSDSSQVMTRAVLVHSDPSYPEVQRTRFARVGGVIPALRVGVMDAEGGETRWLPITMPAEGGYLGQITWAGSSDELLVEKLSRFRDQREFLIADLRTGDLSRLYHETDPAWVDGSYELNLGLEWIQEGKTFLVLSEKDGWRHAYRGSRDGKEPTLLTPGAADILARSRVDQAGGWFYYYASPENAAQRYLFRVPLDGSKPPERVTPASQPGTHHYDFSPDGKWAFHTYSRFDSPPVTELVQMPGHQTVRTLEDNLELQARAKEWISSPTEFLQLEIKDGVVLDAWMIKPDDFDPTKKYPVWVYVYGEPHAQTVLDAWGAAQAPHARVFAKLGYLVVSIDNRGTPAPKGAAWRRAIFGSLGPLSTEEQAAALKALARQCPFADLSRVGIWGWSGGGSNTLNALFRKPELYHVGIAVAPKPQPHLYNAWFQEIYMRTPEVNPEGYQKSAPIHFAEGLKGKLL
ncbi:MAG: DPP IV N-terminal domain-containing protein, partial [Verrucomicrobiae bacterium]|nr:DPP IV N-terminal domain-containing protein [Verrucomicrobiae bacterium]